MNNGQLFAIWDNKAEAYHGGIIVQRAPAAAIRIFGDIASTKDSIIAQHPEDFDLYSLGTINEKHEIEPQRELILSGQKWAAAQPQNREIPDKPEITPLNQQLKELK